MLWELSADQEFFRDTTAKFLDEQVPVETIRRRRHEPNGFDAEYWRRGADLGWTSLLVGEEAGGGSISGDPVVDLTLIAYEFGRHAAPGPLLSSNVVAAALAEAGTRPEVVAELLAGTAVAGWAHTEPRRGLGEIGLQIRVDGSELVLDGVKRPVEAAGQAKYLLVSGRTGDGFTQVLVPADTAGVAITGLQTVDLSARFGTVTFTGARLPIEAAVGEIGGAAAQLERQLQLALVVQTAETVGAMQRGFDMTVDWAADRYSFGRPLASYQAIKHRFADLKSWLEASHAIADAAAAAVSARTADAGELVSVATAYIGEYGAELMQDCVQLHGGIGLTFEHDLHLFLRRVTVNRALYGTPAQHRARVADIAIEREGFAA
ncbi:acyl-CoA dehydrogenase family protein [Nocardia sp. alder85J]|uniref:acyl-CoA dehydrogenase family protein n=1 Tax=Nocardia sp. alder85J TaxID=2862949 RepID=UPI001CD6A6C3|nr:acyl-CoA dehydrogenase family protein [Nocardia sp. alder85J]MCX4095477.1 acyl-CoA/acyl-ACP dehydrogenase [Nocardia sp. alder85J]